MKSETTIPYGYRAATEIGELVEAFERCTLPRERWTHAAFLTVALWYLYLNPSRQARREMRNAVKRYDFQHNIAAGSARGYNETLTVFWLGAVNSYIKRYGNSLPLVELANGLIRRFPDPNLPFRIYSRELLLSPSAKRVWVAPDKFIQNRKFKGAIIL